MACDSQLVGSILIRDCKDVFSGLNSLVDVGGGTGTLAKEIADAFLDLNCIVTDLPHVVDGLVANNKSLAFVGGDMFVAIPPADDVIMKWILHDWNDEECVQMLRKCKEAIPSKENGGKLNFSVIR
ncbi:unnamed protein product [Coffea canephora]|uniref:DH200=94 genomic scaffold, scaffold_2810 n=1 Tax=Coffea canephora TaxID=49390 RepID=A0A068VNE0_COFCA|nr:unnamed protein product [Coffea canephora]